MERYKKKDMLQSVSALIKANNSITGLIASDISAAEQVLIQCQEVAILLGTYIESIGEKYVELVRILENYCENIYLMSESINDEKLCRKLSKKIQRQLVSLENGLKYEMPNDRKEMVFLPYVASMWDSLESIWMAADKDENVDAYVIPIPYYDKNPDGSFRTEHYEGDLFPDYVPVTRYDEYDFENRKPDVVFIHTPYDECNHVTSVHPFFYAKNIKNYTDMLVYIPYFILEEIESNHKRAVDRMKHFCFLPGTIYADKVIVQSEKIRKIYINEYINTAKEMGLSGEHTDRRFLERKIMGTGSPKVDKVLMTRRENLKLPAEWLNFIQKPDGNFKKVVFYNTGISALLHNDERMFIKMGNVFAFFQKKKEDFALLWRPHPLIESTLTSMRPDIWGKYKILRDKYISEEWGIYDNTSDMDRAVALSDIYYGDPSSIVQLYEKTGKLVMIQNAEFQIKDYDSLLNSLNWWVEGDKAWFVSTIYNMLFCADIKTRVCEFVAEIPGGNSLQYCKNPICMGNEDAVFCMPVYGDCIWVFQKNLKQWFKVEIDNFGHNGLIQICWSFVYDNKIYAVSYEIGRIIEINLATKKIENYYLIEIDADNSFISMTQDTIYSLIGVQNKIVCFNVISKENLVYDISAIGKECRILCDDGEKIWLCGCHKEIYIWPKEGGNIRIINDFPEDFGVYCAGSSEQDILDCKTYKYEFPVFISLISVGKYIWCIPYLTNKILYIDKSTYEVKSLDIEEEIETRTSILSRKIAEGRYFLEYVRENRYIGLFSTQNKNIVEIDAEKVTAEIQEYSYSALCREQVEKVFLRENNIMYENAVINLKNYLEDVRDISAEDEVKYSENIGLKIFREIMKC